MRVLFTTAPLHGHLFPLVPLAWAARSMGHDVLVATSDHFVPTALQSGLAIAPVGPGIDLHELADPRAAHGIGDDRLAHGRVFAKLAARNLSGTLALLDSWQPDLVVAERAELAGPIAAAARGVPYAELSWGVAELGEYRTAAESSLRLCLRGVGLDRLPLPNVVLNPWPPSLRRPHARTHLNLRHVPYNGVARVQDWMVEPGARPRICFTLGTVVPQLATRSLHDLVAEMIEQLARLDCELVIAIDDALAAQLGPLPGAVRHAGRVPLSQIVPACELLVHHGGQGTSLTALAAGRPQVVLPLFDDQLENAEAVAASGSGMALPLAEATPERVARYCRDVIGDPAFGKAAAAVAKEIAFQPSPAEIAGVLERLARLEREDRAAA